MSDVYDRLGIDRAALNDSLDKLRMVAASDYREPNQGELEKSWREFQALLQEIVDRVGRPPNKSDFALTYAMAAIDRLGERLLPFSESRFGKLETLCLDLLKEPCPVMFGRKRANLQERRQCFVLSHTEGLFERATGQPAVMTSYGMEKPGSVEDDYRQFVEAVCVDVGIDSTGITERFKLRRRGGGYP